MTQDKLSPKYSGRFSLAMVAFTTVLIHVSLWRGFDRRFFPGLPLFVSGKLCNVGICDIADVDIVHIVLRGFIAI